MASDDHEPNNQLRDARRRKSLTRQELADAANKLLPSDYLLTASEIGRLERGGVDWPRAPRREALRAVLEVESDTEIGFANKRRRPSDAPAAPDMVSGRLHASSPDRPRAVVRRLAGGNETIESKQPKSPRLSTRRDVINDLDEVRRRVTHVLNGESLRAGSVDEWERTAYEYAIETRTRSAPELITDLQADFVELSVDLERLLPASSHRRMTRVAAQMSGLVFLTLIKLDQRQAARHWARTARIAAKEADDSTTMSWVRAQEAYVHYYSGNFLEAIRVARQAQDIAGASSAGLCLAAALEARAYAAIADAPHARVAIARAESTLGDLKDEELIPSAFGYNEAQLRFHEGNALTELGDTPGAQRAHRRALELYPDGDYLDRALVALDGAQCLIQEQDVPGATTAAATVIHNLTTTQRQGLVQARCLRLLASLPSSEQQTRSGRHLRELLTTT